MPMDSSTIVTALLAFVGFVGLIYYRRKTKYWKKKFEELSKPIPPPPPQPKPLTEAEIWHKIRISILTRDGFKCQECGYQNRLEVHHIIPRSKGGTNDPSNLTTLCKRCHDKHHPDRHPRQKIYKKSKHRKHKHRHNFNRNNCPKERIEMVDESDFLEPIGKISSPERRDALYKLWEKNELKQT